MSGEPPLVRHIGGGLITGLGPLTLAQARDLRERLRGRLARLEAEIGAAERWRRAAGWREPDGADDPP